MFGTGEPVLEPLQPRFVAATARLVDSVSRERLRADVQALAEPRGRLHAPEAMERAETFLRVAFAQAGWVAERRPFELREAVGNLDHSGYGPALYSNLSGANFVAIKQGEPSEDALLVGAHYDTVPDSPGADDNASGVAALLELARVLAPYRFRRSVLLTAFDMEEIGLLGARTLVPELNREHRLRGALIFESLAYTASTPQSQGVPPGMDLLYRGQYARLQRLGGAGDFTATIYNGRSTGLARRFAEALAHRAGRDAVTLLRAPADVPLLGGLLRRAVPAVRNFSRSDHVAFWEAGIPAVLVTDTADFRNPNYHRPTDTPSTLDYARLTAIVQATALTIARIAGLRSG